MSRRGRTRRTVLRAGGTAVAAGATASLAGCLSWLPFGGAPVSPTQYLAAPDTFGDFEHGSFSHARLQKLANNEDELSEPLQNALDREGSITEASGLDNEDYAGLLSYGNVSFAKGSLNRSDVVGELEDSDFDEEGDHSGYTVLVAADDSEYSGYAVGVAGNKIVSGQRYGDSDPQEVVEAAIDVAKGEEDRYVDENDDMELLVNRLGVGTITSGGTHEENEDTQSDDFEGVVAEGRRFTVNGSTSKYQRVWVYASESDVDGGDVEDWIEVNQDADGVWEPVDDPTVNEKGRTVVANGKMDTDEYLAQ